MVRVLSALVLISAFSFTAIAQQKAPQGMKRGACKQDIQTYCKGLKGGDGKIHLCLGENKNKLSPNCRASYEYREKRKQAILSGKMKAPSAPKAKQ